MSKKQLDPLVDLAINAVEDLKAERVVTLDVRGLSNVTDYMIIASGASNRQVAAIARNVVEKAKEEGHRPLGVEGEDGGEWVLVDLGDVVVHVMQPHIREFYQLERLWGDTEDRAA